ncbi:Uncharacterised protein [Flavonifractor plautii]|uniref:Uncharacterized protein n=1 Tax=Flavonifractor plautii TaxID=292800 RepID=A0A174PBK0_FLAPL|nr:Uncharacterised protein [Flavonifractor plautii]
MSLWGCSSSDSSRRRSTAGNSILSTGSLKRWRSMAGIRLKSRVAITGVTRLRMRLFSDGSSAPWSV